MPNKWFDDVQLGQFEKRFLLVHQCCEREPHVGFFKVFPTVLISECGRKYLKNETDEKTKLIARKSVSSVNETDFLADFFGRESIRFRRWS